jgi:uncharacterized membrane protein
MRRAAFPLVALLAALPSFPAWADPLVASKTASMQQAIEDITLAAANHDMVLVKDQPIDAALKKRGFGDPHVRILFIGSETAVRWAEAAEPRLLNLLPLRLTLIQRGESLAVMTDDFAPWERAIPDDPGRSMLKAWQIELKAMLEDFVRQ